MAKHQRTEIHIPYDGKEYVLAFTADSLKKAEKQGLLRLGTLSENLTTANENMFSAAFLAHHEFTPKSTRMKIYRELCEVNENEEELIDVINNMIAEALEEINSHQGNIMWTVKRS